MKYVVIPLLVGSFLFIYATPTQAIIILPALILIPIAKLVALILGFMALPTLSLGVVSQKLFGIPRRQVLMSIVLAFIIVGVLVAVLLKLHNGDRPWI